MSSNSDCACVIFALNDKGRQVIVSEPIEVERDSALTVQGFMLRTLDEFGELPLSAEQVERY